MFLVVCVVVLVCVGLIVSVCGYLFICSIVRVVCCVFGCVLFCDCVCVCVCVGTRFFVVGFVLVLVNVFVLSIFV